MYENLYIIDKKKNCKYQTDFLYKTLLINKIRVQIWLDILDYILFQKSMCITYLFPSKKILTIRNVHKIVPCTNDKRREKKIPNAYNEICFECKTTGETNWKI